MDDGKTPSLGAVVHTLRALAAENRQLAVQEEALTVKRMLLSSKIDIALEAFNRHTADTPSAPEGRFPELNHVDGD